MKSQQFAKLMYDTSLFVLKVVSAAFVLEVSRHIFMLA